MSMLQGGPAQQGPCLMVRQCVRSTAVLALQEGREAVQTDPGSEHVGREACPPLHACARAPHCSVCACCSRVSRASCAHGLLCSNLGIMSRNIC